MLFFESATVFLKKGSFFFKFFFYYMAINRLKEHFSFMKIIPKWQLGTKQQR
jgi:hypothetical protein